MSFNLSFALSGVMHFIMFLLLFLFMQFAPSSPLNNATYTIDFIGSTADAAARYGEPQTTAPATKEQEPAPAKPAAPKAPEYAAKDQLITDGSKNKKKTEKPKAAPQPKAEEKVVLNKPSILNEVESQSIGQDGLHNLQDEGGNVVRASFANFPYPWYITQVRNALWRQWSARMPKAASGLVAFVSFSVARDGKIAHVQIDKPSGNESFDYAAASAVAASAPYPALPEDFKKDILTVTVEFKVEE